MSGILEALDMMYEVKGDAELAANYRNKDEKYRSERGEKKRNRYTHDPYNTNDMGQMRNADDYRIRSASNYNQKRYADLVDRISAEKRAKRKAKNECTETIDTLKGILA